VKDHVSPTDNSNNPYSIPPYACVHDSPIRLSFSIANCLKGDDQYSNNFTVEFVNYTSRTEVILGSFCSYHHLFLKHLLDRVNIRGGNIHLQKGNENYYLQC
jgi:hypothetical protein